MPKNMMDSGNNQSEQNYNTSESNDQAFEQGAEKVDKGYEKAKSGVKEGINTAKKIENAPENIANKTDRLANKVENMADKAEKVSDAIAPENIGNTVSNIKDKVADKKEAVKEAGQKAKTAIKNAPEKIKNAAGKTKTAIKNAPKKVKDATLKGANQVKKAYQKGKKTLDYVKNNPGEATAKAAKKAGETAKTAGKNLGNLAKNRGKNIAHNINPVNRVRKKAEQVKRTIDNTRRAARAMAKLARNAAKLIKEAGQLIAKVGAKVIAFLVSNPIGWIIDIVLVVILLFILIFVAVKKSDSKGGTATGGVGYSNITVTDEEKFLMYSLAVHERGGGTEDQLSYVISVVLNRVLTGRHGGTTVKEVIYAPNQFEGVSEVQYSGGHYTSGYGSVWQNQCQAVENYLTNGNTGSESYSNEEVQTAINATERVLASGDTTATPSYPNGGATGFATPYYVLQWEKGQADGEWFVEGNYFGMFNDVDGKEAETRGSNYNNSSSDSHNFFSCTEDQEILAQFVTVSSGGTTGNVGLGTFTGESGQGYWNTYQIAERKYKLYYQNWPSAENNWNIGGRGLCHVTSQAILLSCDTNETPKTLYDKMRLCN